MISQALQDADPGMVGLAIIGSAVIGAVGFWILWALGERVWRKRK